MAESTPLVSVVLPVFNEVTHLEEEVTRISKALEESGLSYEIIVVDDGSTDGSGELAGTLDVRLLRFATNRGSGSARKYGTMSANGEVVVWTDVDMTYPNDQIADLVREMDGYDQVVGARKSEEGTVKFLRGPAKWLIRKLASYLSRETIKQACQVKRSASRPGHIIVLTGLIRAHSSTMWRPLVANSRLSALIVNG